MSVDETQVLERTLEVVQKKMPDLAERYMRVPLTYYTNEEVAARERHLFMTQPIPLLAASEIAEPNSYFVRMAMGRYKILVASTIKTPPQGKERPTPISSTNAAACSHVRRWNGGT